MRATVTWAAVMAFVWAQACAPELRLYEGEIDGGDAADAGTEDGAGGGGAACAELGSPCTNGKCNDAGTCVACLADVDCDGGVCESGECRLQPCGNMVEDGMETDVDCGGGECAPCANGRKCVVDGDCSSGICSQSLKECQ